MSVEITKITLDIDGQNVELTREQAEELWEKLDMFFGNTWDRWIKCREADYKWPLVTWTRTQDSTSGQIPRMFIREVGND